MEVQTLFGRLASDKEESLAHVLDGQVRRAAGLDAETRRTARGHGATWTPRRTARAWTARRDGRRELGRRDGPAGELWAWTGCGAGRRDETDGEGPASHLDGPRGELWAWTGCGATLDAETGQRAAWTGCGATWTPRRATGQRVTVCPQPIHTKSTGFPQLRTTHGARRCGRPWRFSHLARVRLYYCRPILSGCKLQDGH